MFTLSSPPAILSASVSLPEKRELRLPMASETSWFNLWVQKCVHARKPVRIIS